MSDPEKPPTTSTSINAQGDVNVGRDVVGRDKIETHQHIQQAPSADQGWAMFHEAGCLARTLLILGAILIVGAFLGFIGMAIYTVSLASSASVQQSVEQGFAMGPYFVGSFGVFFVGMVMVAVGSSMASYDSYRKKKSSQSK